MTNTIRITEHAPEEGTFPIVVSFWETVDGVAALVTPNNDITWTLTDKNGTVVNARSSVAAGTPATSITIVLKGDDLALSDTYVGRLRYLLVECTYDSAEYGNDCPFKAQAEFVIDDFVKVTA